MHKLFIRFVYVDVECWRASLKIDFAMKLGGYNKRTFAMGMVFLKCERYFQMYVILWFK